MFLSIVKICPVPAKAQEVLDILLSVRGPTVAASGCLECSIYEEQDDEHAIVYLEKWQSEGGDDHAHPVPPLPKGTQGAGAFQTATGNMVL